MDKQNGNRMRKYYIDVEGVCRRSVDEQQKIIVNLPVFFFCRFFFYLFFILLMFRVDLFLCFICSSGEMNMLLPQIKLFGIDSTTFTLFKKHFETSAG